ncbi:Predicted N-acetyltransferase YhbS [Ruminococcus sp. YE282]|nr:Predicted N-acetyltransferase YhbS [Ruminococcus bromii]
MLHCYRKDPAFVSEPDFVMELDGELIGQVIYVRSEIDCDDGRKVPIMTFGPIGIAQKYKRQGYGKHLLDYSMEKAKEMGVGALAITGNILFYGKSGFVPAKTKGIRYADDPEADYFLIKELMPDFLGGISGTYKDPEGYFVCEKYPDAFEKYEATFPKKEKLKLPGQLF